MLYDDLPNSYICKEVCCAVESGLLMFIDFEPHGNLDKLDREDVATCKMKQFNSNKKAIISCGA